MNSPADSDDMAERHAGAGTAPTAQRAIVADISPAHSPNGAADVSSAGVGHSRRSVLALGAGAIGTLAMPTARGEDRAGAATNAAEQPIQIPARNIYPPTSISASARAFLGKGGSEPYVPSPPLTDIAAWKSSIAEGDRKFMAVAERVLELPGIALETKAMGGATVYVATPSATSPEARKPHFYIHGGGWVGFAGKPAMILTKVIALYYGGTVYGIDYRTPPDHPFPAPLDDCLSAYRELLKTYSPEKLLVSGESAGGNLAAALMLRARDEGLPSPAALLLNTPATDLTFASDSIKTNEYIDVLLKHWDPKGAAALYVGQADPKNPYVSPLLGDLSRGFPPTYLRTGTRDLLLSDTVRMHAALRKAGVEADLYVGEAMPHGGLGGVSPEDVAARADTVRWLKRHWTA